MDPKLRGGPWLGTVRLLRLHPGQLGERHRWNQCECADGLLCGRSTHDSESPVVAFRAPPRKFMDMVRLDPSKEGFIHGQRIVYAVMYRLEGDSSLIVWFDRGGNDLNGRVAHSDRQRRIVTARPGEMIFYCGQPRRIVSLE